MEVGAAHREPVDERRPGRREVESEPGEAGDQEQRRRPARTAQNHEREPERDQRPAREQVGKPVTEFAPGVLLLLAEDADDDAGAGDREERDAAH